MRIRWLRVGCRVIVSMFAIGGIGSVHGAPRINRVLDTRWKIYTVPKVSGGRILPLLTPSAVKKLQCPASGPKWRAVNLPDDYIVDGKFTHRAVAGHGSLPVYPAWYRRGIHIPASAMGKTVWLNFGGVYRDAVVFVNGQFVGQHPSGYTGFRYNISKFIHYGRRNHLTVYVNPRWFEGWWYEGGGIYRHVRLMITDKLHVAPWGTFVISKVPGSIHYGASDGDYADADLTIQTTVDNEHRTVRQFTLLSRVIGPTGTTLATISTREHLPASRKMTFIQHAAINNAALWSLHHCNLYHLETTLRVNHATVDDKRTTFGIRTLRFDPNQGFFLDGKRVEIKGTANHQDFPGVGIGAPDNLWYWRIAKLKAMGSNAYRCSHNPLATSFYRACDHLGMLVMDENRHLGDAWTAKSPRPGAPGYSNLSDLKAMILQHRNYPCIIFWSMCNEENQLQGTREGAGIFSAMMHAVHHLDPTRPVTSAMNGGYNKKGFFSVENLLGINYHCYLYSSIHRQYPHQMLFGSEDVNCYSARGVLESSRASGLCSEFGFIAHRGFFAGHEPWRSWIPVVEHPFVAGEFIWTGFDYRGEPNPYGWPAVTSQTGCMDLCGFPKPCYYYWRAWWEKKPSVYIFPAWTFPKSMAGQPITVRCYSNCDRVTLFLNGKDLGSKQMPKYRYLDWTIPYTPGVLIARGYNAGQVVTHYTLRTAGPPAGIRLMDQYPNLDADGESDAPIAVEVVDAAGHVVPDAQNKIQFAVSGAGSLAGVANGNPVSHESNIADWRRAFHGLCMVMVRAGDKAGTINVTARSPGLKVAKLELRTMAAGRYPQ